MKNVTRNCFIMLNIFAIDPEICRDPEWFRYCIEHCHPSQGRMIADLPPGGWDVEANKVIKKQASKEKEKKTPEQVSGNGEKTTGRSARNCLEKFGL